MTQLRREVGVSRSKTVAMPASLRRGPGLCCALPDLRHFHDPDGATRWRLNRTHQRRGHFAARDEPESLCPGTCRWNSTEYRVDGQQQRGPPRPDPRMYQGRKIVARIPLALTSASPSSRTAMYA